MKRIVPFVLLCCPVQAAITPATTAYHSKCANGTTHACTTATFDSTGADLIVLPVDTYGGSGLGADSVAVTDSFNNTWSLCGTNYAFGGVRNVATWYVKSPVNAGPNHTVTITKSYAYPAAQASAWKGSDPNPCGVASGSGGTGSSTVTSGTISTGKDGSLVITALSNGSSTQPTVASPFTILDASTNAASATGATSFWIQPTAGSVSTQWTSDTGSKATMIVSFSAGGSVPIPPIPVPPTTISVLPPLVYDPATGVISCPTCIVLDAAGNLSIPGTFTTGTASNSPGVLKLGLPNGYACLVGGFIVSKSVPCS